MLHRLLACLALLTGLSLLGAPAHAREAAAVAAQVEQRAAQAVACATVVEAGQDKAAPELVESVAAQLCRAADPVLAPGVLFGPDRALE